MRSRLAQVLAENEQLRNRAGQGQRVFAADLAGEVVPLRFGRRPGARSASTALALWRPEGWPFGG